jgi:uncharacterized protein YndB with AHSA1/START domain
MPAQIKRSQVIDRPVADVFRFIADEHARNHPRWDPDIQLEQITEGPMRVGSILRRTNRRHGTPVEGTMEVVEYEPNQVFSTKIHDGDKEMIGRMTFTAIDDDHTQITTHVDIPWMEDTPENMEFMEARMERSEQTRKRLIEAEIDV